MASYYKTKESVEEYIQMARGHDGKHHIMQLTEFLPRDSYLLELGSGPGTDWKILSQFYRVVGSDFSPEFLKHLQASHPKGDFIQLDASTLETDSSFDGIYSNKVLHHLEDDALEASIRRQSEILNPGGLVCHTFWKGEDSEMYNDLFVNYHTEAGIRALFKEHFHLLVLQLYKEFEVSDSILYIGKKREG